MNFTESFEQFSKSVGPMDLALYAGVVLVLFVLFKDKMSPVQKIVSDIFSNVSNLWNSRTEQPSQITINVPTIIDSTEQEDKNLFFDIVVSWKQTRDLAQRSGCSRAVEVADQMFPFLSPVGCEKSTEVSDEV